MDDDSGLHPDGIRHDWLNLWTPRLIDESLIECLGSPEWVRNVDPSDSFPPAEHKVGCHRHRCPDVEPGIRDTCFPFGPMLRDRGTCTEPIPMSCSFCLGVNVQPCKSTYRVALSGADWDGFRDRNCDIRETGVLVECMHCGAPGDFHIQLALFKGYYSEVLDLVLKGRMSLFDVRRSVIAVANWPPAPGGQLVRLISQLANQLSTAIAESPLPGTCGALVIEYWQGAAQDYLLPSAFSTSMVEMYQCNHGWPCVGDDGVRQHCKWLQWAQLWIHELMVCDGRIDIPYYHARNYLPDCWGEWIERRKPEWREAKEGERNWNPQPPGPKPLGYVKSEDRMDSAWYTYSTRTPLTCVHRNRATGEIHRHQSLHDRTAVIPPPTHSRYVMCSYIV